MPRNNPQNASALFRDLAAGLHQQMFYWGKDVVHPDGNLFVAEGFEKQPSPGLQGTSCYSLPWENGRIELHGSCAGWVGREGGFFYIRPLGRCVNWLDPQPPVPGEWPRERLAPAGFAEARPFLAWWLHHEARVEARLDPGWRRRCHRHFRKLPRSRAWLAPDLATRWIRSLHDDPSATPRVRRFAANSAATASTRRTAAR